jgi:hypothetical protein
MPNMPFNVRWRHVLAFACLMPCLAPMACAPNEPDRVVLDSIDGVGQASTGIRWRIDDPILLATTGPVSIDVDNFAGSVSVRANPTLSDTRVVVERASHRGWFKYESAGEELGRIEYVVGLDRDLSGGEVVTVRSDHVGRMSAFGRANIRIETPELDAVKVRTTRGDVMVIDQRGELDIRTTHGDVRVATPWPARDAVSIMNQDGDVEYRIRGESTGRFDLETINGTVNHRCRYGTWRGIGPDNRSDRIVAVLNNGENPIVIRTTEGDIDVAVVSDPVGLGPFLTNR